MKKIHLIIIGLTALAVFALVYSIHWNYHLPYHIDEWHHIGQAVRLGNFGEYFQVLKGVQANRFSGLELGFHLFLYFLSFVFNLVSVYQFLPAIWAALSALAIFFVVYKKTDDNFWIGWLSMVFFASIKSNVNITGLWFFTPLSFSIPLIFLYFYFFSEGLEKKNNQYLLISLAIMILLIPTHSISLLFALPALAIYSLINFKKVIEQPWIFIAISALGAAGLFFYMRMINLDWLPAISHLWTSLQFRYGWGVIEARVPLTDLYSQLGYLTALIGLIFIIVQKKSKRYSLYIIWPITVFIMMAVYLATGISYLSPYQRNLYYFALAMPFFSAFGLYSLAIWIWSYSSKWQIKNELLRVIKYALLALTAIIVGLMVFSDYYRTPEQFGLYQAISADDMEILNYLAELPRSTVMAPPILSTALLAVARQDPVGDLLFYGNVKYVSDFYMGEDCAEQKKIIDSAKAKYIISPFEINCDFGNLIKYNASDYLYRIR